MPGLKNDQRLEITGISLTPGVAIGKAFRFKQIDLESLLNNTFPIENITVELKRLQSAIQKSKDQLHSLQKAATENNKNDVADIFAAHVQLLQDETFLQNIRDAIKLKRLNVEHILSVNIREVENTFSSMSNETVRTRLFDIQDVYQRILRNLLEIEHVRVTPLLRSKSNPILIAEHLLPSDIALLEFRKIAGIIIEESSAVSHVAIITRAFGIPAIINVPGITSLIHADNTIILDGDTGIIIINPSQSEITNYKRKRNGSAEKHHPQQIVHNAITRDGIRIRLEANANTPEEVKAAIVHGAEGIGLLRSEIFYLGHTRLPDCKEELSFYHEIHKAAEGAPVTIRLLDLGADKSLPYVEIPYTETNPQLGLRGIRYLFANPKLLDRHLRSVLLASKYGLTKVLVPFVSIIQEIDYLLEMIETIIIEEHLDHTKIKLGIMVEIPSVIWSLPQFIQKLDFLSIGTNDLIQFTFASDREDNRLEEYRRASIPVLLKMIQQIISVAHAFEKEVNVCGEAASDPAVASLLIGAGIRELSARVNALDSVRKEIEGTFMGQAQAAVQDYLEGI
jgi:phosphotransferase system enzyme I (PtsI)